MEIANWFWQVYNRPDNFESFVAKLASFTRQEGENIEVFMARYLMIATQADSFLPQGQKYYTMDFHTIQVIGKSLRGEAKTDYFKWKDEQTEGGFKMSYGNALAYAMHREKYHKTVPKTSFDIDCTNVHLVRGGGNLDLNAMRTGRGPKNPENTRGQKHKDNTKVTAPQPDKSSSPKDPVDPHRASGFRSPYYVALRRQEKEKAKYEKNKEKGIKGPDKPVSFRGSRQNGYPSVKTVPADLVGKKGRNPPGVVNKDYYGLLCGVPVDPNAKFLGSDHTTNYCPFYRNYTFVPCKYCFQTFNINANHYQKVCRRMKKKFRQANEADFDEPPASEFEQGEEKE